MSTSTIPEYIGWVGRDNWIGFTLSKGDPLEDLTAVEMDDVTKYGFRYNGIEYNTTTHPAFCRKTSASSRIEFQPGLMIDESGKDSKCELLVYDAVNVEGLVWGTYFKLKMRDDATD